MIGKAASAEEALRGVDEQAPRGTRPSHGDRVFVLHAGTRLQFGRAYRERLDRPLQ